MPGGAITTDSTNGIRADAVLCPIEHAGMPGLGLLPLVGSSPCTFAPPWSHQDQDGQYEGSAEAEPGGQRER
jgi:hypothetical protein